MTSLYLFSEFEGQSERLKQQLLKILINASSFDYILTRVEIALVCLQQLIV